MTKHQAGFKVQHVNILLLGEIGVGKSTYINAFNNYVKYPDLDEAERRNEISYLVATAFDYVNDNFQPVRVELGHEHNECFIEGQSSTRHAQAYSFELDDKIIQFIDTPGFGDYRGVDVDRKNFDETVEYLKNFDHLDAVLFLLKPNTKLSHGFLFCFKEFFSHFNASSVDNICFGFTHTRATMYKPGDALPILAEYIEEIHKASRVEIPLRKENIFCFDNESFRYLVLTYNGMSKSKDRDTYAVSWEKSATSSAVFLTYVLTQLEPKAIDNMLLFEPLSEPVSVQDVKFKALTKRQDSLGKLLCSCLCWK